MENYLIGDIEYGGFGAMWARRKLLVQISEAFGLIPIYRFTNHGYPDPFKPIGPTFQNLIENQMLTSQIPLFGFVKSAAKVQYFHFEKYWASEFRRKYQIWHPDGRDYMGYSGQLYSRFNLNQGFTEQVSTEVNRVINSFRVESLSNFVGIHFRRGDKLTELAKYLDPEVVINLVKSQYVGSPLYVCSDDNDFLHHLEYAHRGDIQIFFDREESRFSDATMSNAEYVRRNPAKASTEVVTFLKNTFLLSSCKAVFGMHSSQLTKISGSIGSYLKGKVGMHLIDPVTNALRTMGDSVETS